MKVCSRKRNDLVMTLFMVTSFTHSVTYAYSNGQQRSASCILTIIASTFSIIFAVYMDSTSCKTNVVVIVDAVIAIALIMLAIVALAFNAKDYSSDSWESPFGIMVDSIVLLYDGSYLYQDHKLKKLWDMYRGHGTVGFLDPSGLESIESVEQRCNEKSQRMEEIYNIKETDLRKDIENRANAYQTKETKLQTEVENHKEIIRAYQRQLQATKSKATDDLKSMGSMKVMQDNVIRRFREGLEARGEELEDLEDLLLEKRREIVHWKKVSKLLVRRINQEGSVFNTILGNPKTSITKTEFYDSFLEEHHIV